MVPQVPHNFEFIHFRSIKDIPHLLMVILLISGIFLGVYLALQPQLFNKKASEGSLVDLQFVPDSLQIQTGNTYEAKINIMPKGQRVTAVQLDLEYDPTVMTILEVKNGGFSPITLRSQDRLDGTFSLIYGSTIESKSDKDGTVANIKFRVLSSKDSKLSVKGNSQINVSSQEANALTNFPSLSLQSTGGANTDKSELKYPDNLLLEKAVLPDASPFVRDFREGLKPDPSFAPERVKPGFSGAYVKQLGKDIIIDPIIALNQVIEEKTGEIIKSNK